MKSRWLAICLALVGAAAMGLAAIEPWWKAGETAIGPAGTHHCFGGDCRSTSLLWLGGSDLWMRSAVATRTAALIAFALLVLLAGAVAAKRVPKLVARTTMVALSAAVVVGAYFFVKYPSPGGDHLGIGGLLYAVGIVSGAFAAI